MFASARSRVGGGWAATLAFAVATVWLAASCAALSLDLAAASHDCCDAQQGGAACRSLCASTNGAATPALSIEMTSASWATHRAEALPSPASIAAVVPVNADLPADLAVPLYLRNASFLI